MVTRVTENTQQLRPANLPAVQAGNFDSSAIAQGGESLGRSLQQAASNLNDIQTIHDEAAVRKADAEDVQQISKIRAEALTSQGLDADVVTRTALAQMENIRKDRLASLKTPRQRHLYDQVFNQRKATIIGDFTTHAVKETVTARKEASAARADSYRNAAIDSYDSPQAFKDNVATAVGELDNIWAGADPKVKEQKKLELVSSIHASVIEKLAANPDNVEAAEKWRRDHSEEILPETETKLAKLLNPGLQENQTLADVGMVMHGGAAPTGDPAAPADPLAPKPDAPKPAKGFEPAPISNDPIKAVLRGVGRVSSGFHDSRDGGKRQHNAVDIAAPAGTPIHPPMSGQVIKSWFDSEHGGGWSLLIKHPNGYVTGYAHMKSQSPFSAGDTVDRDTVIGGVGNTGSGSHGNHLHYTVREAGAKVDPETVMWTGGKTPATDKASGTAPVDMASVSWKEGELPVYSAEKPQLAQMLQRAHTVATQQGWGPQRYERVVSEIRRQAGINESLYNKAQDDRYNTAADALATAEQNGTPITNVGDIPGFGLLEGPHKITILNAVQANKKAQETGASIPANGPTFLDLLEGSATDPQSFAQIDLRTVPDITPGERARLTGVQSKLRVEGTNGTFAASHSRIYTMIDRYAAPADYATGQKATDTDRRKRTLLFDSVREQVNQRQNKLGRELTDDELEALVKSQTVAMVRHTPALFGTERTESIPRYLAERTPRKEGERRTVAIPKTDHDQIIAAWKRANGGAMPSEGTITAIYLRRMAQGL
jgi:murein DD-endopeptidase MepM/ murein hydrolase activator NlpD